MIVIMPVRCRYLRIRDVKAALSEVGGLRPGITDEDLFQDCAQFDKGHKGALELDEFLCVFARQKRRSPIAAEYDVIYRSLGGNPDLSGTVDLAELSQRLSALGLELHPQEFCGARGLGDRIDRASLCDLFETQLPSPCPALPPPTDPPG
ncbi:hypothetical protein PAPYR_3960 [Paratrimastix pyriformis]|uniref:EF-hand domain-containing protein n=1 Tax=Paratrimastix pyriformis TaxID=342808 RepID=A0ABQ8UQB9_9EUKA|nr:hypothetical protein PAPYR_3960 [Paratrimastix pyriformis]